MFVCSYQVVPHAKKRRQKQRKNDAKKQRKNALKTA